MTCRQPFAGEPVGDHPAPELAHLNALALSIAWGFSLSDAAENARGARRRAEGAREAPKLL